MVDPALPYLVPPQTAGDAFFIWTSKTGLVIKIAPAFGCGDQPLRSENGMWERRLAKCANSALTCLRLNFNRFQRGRGGGRSRVGGVKERAFALQQIAIIFDADGLGCSKDLGSTGNSVILRHTNVFTLELW